MQKMILLCHLLLFFGRSTFAQQLSTDERIVFDEVVFARSQIGEYEKIQKWIIPIRYKIYGDAAAYLINEVDSNFSQIKKLTSLDIKKTEDDDEVNFVIVFGKTPEAFSTYTLNKQPLTSPGSYRRKVNKDGEIVSAQNLFNTEKFNSRAVIKNAMKQQLLRVIGFQKTTKLLSDSLFSASPNLKNKFDDFDNHIISALYSPLLKPGMTKTDVEKILGN